MNADYFAAIQQKVREGQSLTLKESQALLDHVRFMQGDYDWDALEKTISESVAAALASKRPEDMAFDQIPAMGFDTTARITRAVLSALSGGRRRL